MTIQVHTAPFNVLPDRARPGYAPAAHEALDDRLAAFNELLSDAMARSGVFYTVRRDLDVWASRMETAPGIAAVNPTFDPRHSDQSRSFWIDLHDRNGEPMAMIASKLVESEDYVAMMMNGTA
jgi:hypothetical protein